MTLTGLLVDTGTVATDFFGLATMALIGRNETDTAVAVLVVVPVNECTHSQTGFLQALEGSLGEVRPVFHSAEQRLREGVVDAHPWPGEGSQHPQLLQPAFEGGGPQLFEKPAARQCRCRRGGSAAGFGPCRSAPAGKRGSPNQRRSGRLPGRPHPMPPLCGSRRRSLDRDRARRHERWSAGRCRGRTGAPYQPFSWWVSPARPPNRTCGSHRIRLSTGSCQCLSCPWRGDATASVAVANDFDPRGSEQFAAAFPYLPAREVAAMQCSPIQPEVPLP